MYRWQERTMARIGSLLTTAPPLPLRQAAKDLLYRIGNPDGLEPTVTLTPEHRLRPGVTLKWSVDSRTVECDVYEYGQYYQVATEAGRVVVAGGNAINLDDLPRDPRSLHHWLMFGWFPEPQPSAA